MEPDPYSYPPLQVQRSAEKSVDEGPEWSQYPDRKHLRAAVEQVGFPATRQGQGTIMAALRGSTATFYTDEGFRFRHPKSDIDIIALTNAVGAQNGARYLFYVLTDLPPVARDMDILCFSPARVAVEQESRRRIFLTTKLIQPGIPLYNDPIYEQYKMQAMAVLIMRGAIRREVRRVTPSGAARLVLEEDLFAEPWRWLSMRTYYLDAPSASRQRARLTQFAQMALERLAARGQANDITYRHANSVEPVFELALPDWRYGPLLLERQQTMLGFVYDQFSILLHSGGKSFTPDKAVSFALKAISLSKNPFLRFDADVVFGPRSGERTMRNR